VNYHTIKPKNTGFDFQESYIISLSVDHFIRTGGEPVILNLSREKLKNV